jgi:hypothetical protein
MSKTMSAQESLQFVHDELNLTWDEIADRIGVFCGAHWRMIALGERKLSRRADNAFRAALGKPARGVERIADMRPAHLARAVRERVEL